MIRGPFQSERVRHAAAAAMQAASRRASGVAEALTRDPASPEAVDTIQAVEPPEVTEPTRRGTTVVDVVDNGAPNTTPEVVVDTRQDAPPARGRFERRRSPDEEAVPAHTFDEAAQAHLHRVELGGCVCVVAVDIDHFEALTAMHGPVAAVEVLAAAASRIHDAVRPHDLVFRVEGNGFALAWRQADMTTAPADIGARISRHFEAPIPTSAGDLSVTVSIGVCSVNHDEAHLTGPQSMLAQARAAVTAARRRGWANIAEFDPIMLESAVQTYQTENELRSALRNEMLAVNYQPIVNLMSGHVVGVEALARWRNEHGVSVSPGLFIPVAEESGLINDLGRVVLRNSLAQGDAWRRERGVDALLSVNLSNNQLLDPSLIPTIRRLLDEHELDPGRLCLEITESVVMSNVAASMTILCKLKDLGLLLAIDDFGTGYSSLSYLRRLPVDILKIDQSFVQSLHNRDDRIITKVIIDLAHTLGMTTIAEGVESRDQLEMLRDLRCDMAQGFLLHLPADPGDVRFEPIDLSSLQDLALFPLDELTPARLAHGSA